MSAKMDQDFKIPKTSIPPPLDQASRPPGNSPDLQLVPATELERTQCWHINCNEWRGPLSPSEYFQREAFLASQSLVSNDQITFWILTFKDHAHTRNAADAPRPIFASCETLLKSAFVAKNGHLKSVLAHGIGSVFCRSEYRGKGYASRMISELGDRLGAQAWQQPPNPDQALTRGFFSILYSDIGQEFYARHGWKPMPSTHITLAPISSSDYTETRQRLSLPTVTDLKTSDIDSICQAAIAEVEAELTTRSASSPSVPFVAVRPDIAHMTWHFAREDFQAHILFKGTKSPDVKGALDPSTGCALLWCRVWRDTPELSGIDILKTIVPSTLVANGNEEAAVTSLCALLLRAQREARDWDMHAGVEVWSPDATTLLAAQILSGAETKVEVVVREKEHVCSLRWEGGEEGKGDGNGDEVEWLASEKFAWC